MFEKEINLNYSNISEKNRALRKINFIISSIFCSKHHVTAHLEIKGSKWMLSTCCEEHGEYIARVIEELLE
jgi:hypothetical protein